MQCGPGSLVHFDILSKPLSHFFQVWNLILYFMSNRFNKNAPSTFVKTASAGHPVEEKDGMRGLILNKRKYAEIKFFFKRLNWARRRQHACFICVLSNTYKNLQSRKLGFKVWTTLDYSSVLFMLHSLMLSDIGMRVDFSKPIIWNG